MLPEGIYDNFVTEIKKAETNRMKFKTKKVNIHDTIVVERTRCSEVAPKLEPLAFLLGRGEFKIEPQGYLIDLPGGDCQVAIEKVDANQHWWNDDDIRLGTVFLQNFYTILNYDENSI